MLKVIRVNMKTKNIKIEEFDTNIVFGNRGLIAKTLIEEVDPKCDPLGKENKLVFATGLFGGYNFPTGNRLSAGAKSPLTGTIKESSVGGTAGTNLGMHGIKMIIFEDIPSNDEWYFLRIDGDGNITLESADKYISKGTYETAEELKKECGGKTTSVCAIGPAGERMYKIASIQVTDFTTQTPSRACGRGGLGAVMGSKHIKAIVIERAKEKAKLPAVDEEKVKSLIKELTKATVDSPTKPMFESMGTTGLLSLLTIPMNAYPVNNFSGKMLADEKADLMGNGYTERINQYGGKQGVGCQAGCPIKCSNFYCDEEGKLITAGLEYETVALGGPNCDIYDWDYIAEFDHVCDNIGVDTIDMGNAIAIAMDAGYIPWGDIEGARKILQEFKDGEGFGNILGNGAQAVGDYFKHNRIPTCKGQAFAAYDPRAVKGLGVTYATFTQGADHTGANTISLPLDHSDPNGQVEASKNMQVAVAISDCFLQVLFAESCKLKIQNVALWKIHSFAS